MFFLVKVISVIASPHKNGNCRRIVDMLTEIIEKNGGVNEVYFVDDLNIKPCQACMGCRNMSNPSRCVINDDFRMIMDRFYTDSADYLIFAAPNYFGEFNAQAHIFMDRFYSMTKSTPNRLDGDKKAVVIHTYGASDGYYDEYLTKRANLFKSIGFSLEATLGVGENIPTRNSSSSNEILDKIRKIGERIK